MVPWRIADTKKTLPVDTEKVKLEAEVLSLRNQVDELIRKTRDLEKRLAQMERQNGEKNQYNLRR